MRSEKFQTLRDELDSKMDEWRERLLQVQAESIRKAEQRAHEAIRKRRERTASLSRERTSRHQELFKAVSDRESERVKEGREGIARKLARIDSFKTEREKSADRARRLAQKTSELRELLL